MSKKVSADTATELSMNSGFSPGSYGAPPTAQQMIDQIRADLTLKVEALTKLADKSKGDPNAPPTAFQIALSRATKDLAEFEKIVADVPKGFRLTPLLYSKIEQQQNAKVYREYTKRVRPFFLHYLAHNHAAELTALGICQNGIEKMKKGLDPVDEHGRLYGINIDHIIERSGGGNWSLQKALDPLMPAGSSPTYIVNHFANFVLIPKKLHDVKNTLNNLQKASYTIPGESRWVLMIVPETGPGRSGYVAAPQGAQSPNNAAAYKHENMEHTIRHAEFMVDRVQDTLEVFRGLAPQQSLSQIFNDAAALTPEQQARLDTFVKPAITDMTSRLKAAFDGVMKSKPASYNHRIFMDVYQGQALKAVRQDMAHLPFAEAVKFIETMQQIDTGLAEFNKRAVTPSNDNRKLSGQKHYKKKSQRPQKRHRRHHGRRW